MWKNSVENALFFVVVVYLNIEMEKYKDEQLCFVLYISLFDLDWQLGHFPEILTVLLLECPT